MTGPWRKPRKWNLPLTYEPKIPGVIDGTIQQTIRVGRSSISCELNPEYVEIAKKRLRIGEQLDSGVCEYEVRSLLMEV